jgi:hypothetical protein
MRCLQTFLAILRLYLCALTPSGVNLCARRYVRQSNLKQPRCDCHHFSLGFVASTLICRPLGTRTAVAVQSPEEFTDCCRVSSNVIVTSTQVNVVSAACKPRRSQLCAQAFARRTAVLAQVRNTASRIRDASKFSCTSILLQAVERNEWLSRSGPTELASPRCPPEDAATSAHPLHLASSGLTLPTSMPLGLTNSTSASGTLPSRLLCTTTTSQAAGSKPRPLYGGPATAWIAATPAAPTLRLNTGDFCAAGRHLLGLGAPTGVAAPPCLCGAGCAATADHAMVCKQVARENQFHHNSWVSAWRRVISRAGCASSAEPPYSGLATPGAQRGNTCNNRGDIITVMPDGRVLVLDTVVTHPAAASHVAAASQTTGTAAARAERDKRREYADMAQEDAGYDFVPLAVESYGRLGGAALSFLSSLGDIAAADGRLQGGVHAVGASGAQLPAVSRQRAHVLCVHVRDCAGSGPDVHAGLSGAGGGCWACLKGDGGQDLKLCVSK